MSAFHDAATPEDLPPWCQGEPDPQETADTAVTEWFGGRQAHLDEAEEETDAEYQRSLSE